MKITKTIKHISIMTAVLLAMSVSVVTVNAKETAVGEGIVSSNINVDSTVEKHVDKMNNTDIFSERTNMLYTHQFNEDILNSEQDMTEYDRLVKEHQQKLTDRYALEKADSDLKKKSDKNTDKKSAKSTEKKAETASSENDGKDDLIVQRDGNTVYVNYGRFGVLGGAYMGYHMITAVSDQLTWKLTHDWYYDDEGFVRYKGRYLIACTTTFGNVGDWVDFHLENGEVIKGIIGDIKWDGDSTYCVFGHVLNGNLNVTEFIVSPSWYSGHENPATASCHPEWDSKVLYAVCKGDCDTSVSGTEPETSDHSEETTTKAETETSSTSKEKVTEKETKIEETASAED